MRRKTVAATGSLVALLGSLLLLAAPAAVAQTGYPPGVCTVTVGAQDAGSHLVGDTFSVTLSPACPFTAGAAVNLVVNGVAVGTKVADANGFVTVNITVASANQLLINDPVRVTGQCGTNTVVATGPSAAAKATVTQTGTFQVLCPGAAATPVQGRVAFTGANVLRWAAVALTLVLLGAILVVADRRRGRRSI